MKKLALVLALGLLAVPAVAQDKTVDLKISIWLPPAHPLFPPTKEWAADIEKQSGGKSAVSVFRQNKAAWAHRLVDEVFSFKKRKDSFSAIVDQSMKLTKDEAAEFMGEVDEVLARWADKTRGRSRDRRTYVFYSMVQPYLEDGKDA